jgi:hypothetical protein
MIGVVLACLLGVFLFSPLFSVREIRLQRGQGRVNTVDVQKSLSDLFGRHLLLLSTHDVLERVRTVVPDLEGVELRKHYPSRILVHIELQPLVARLVFDEPPASETASESGSTLEVLPHEDVLTSGGLYMSTIKSNTGTTLPSIRITDWAVRPVPGTQLISEDMMKRMNEVEQTLAKEFAQKVKGRVVFIRAREFHILTGKIELWFDMQSSLKDQFDRYRTYLKAVGLNGAAQYVDLRLQGRVVYR